MKFTVQAAPLLDALKSVQARTKSNAVELLKHIRFDVAGSRLALLGHDTGSSSEATIPVDGASEGICAVPGDAIVRLIGSLPKETHVVIERQDLQITIKAGRSRYKLPILVVDSFPGALPCDDAISVDLSTEDIAQLFARPRPALNLDDQRPQMHGIYLHMADGFLAAAGTDSYHFVRTLSKAVLRDLVGVLVPFAAAETIENLGADGGRLSICDRSIAFEAADRRYCSRLIDSKYFDYANQVPRPGSYVDVDRAELLDAVRRLSILSLSESEISLEFQDGEIVASLAGTGEGIETIASTGDGHGATLVVAPKQLVAALAFPKAETIQIHTQKGRTTFLIVDSFEPSAIFVEATRLPKSARRAAA